MPRRLGWKIYIERFLSLQCANTHIFFTCLASCGVWRLAGTVKSGEIWGGRLLDDSIINIFHCLRRLKYTIFDSFLCTIRGYRNWVAYGGKLLEAPWFLRQQTCQLIDDDGLLCFDLEFWCSDRGWWRVAWSGDQRLIELGVGCLCLMVKLLHFELAYALLSWWTLGWYCGMRRAIGPSLL